MEIYPGRPRSDAPGPAPQKKSDAVRIADSFLKNNALREMFDGSASAASAAEFGAEASREAAHFAAGGSASFESARQRPNSFHDAHVISGSQRSRRSRGNNPSHSEESQFGGASASEDLQKKPRPFQVPGREAREAREAEDGKAGPWTMSYDMHQSDTDQHSEKNVAPAPPEKAWSSTYDMNRGALEHAWKEPFVAWSNNRWDSGPCKIKIIFADNNLLISLITVHLFLFSICGLTEIVPFGEDCSKIRSIGLGGASDPRRDGGTKGGAGVSFDEREFSAPVACNHS